MHDHRVARLHVVHGAADLAHPARVLVAEDVRERRMLDRVPLALNDVQIGAAQPRGADVDDDVPGSGDGGLGDLIEDGVLSVGV